MAKKSGNNLNLTVKRSEDDNLTYGLFNSLEIDGVTVDSAYYDEAEGSLKLSIKPEYLETLSVGDHIAKVNFQDGSATVNLTVLAASENEDDSEDDNRKTKPNNDDEGDSGKDNGKTTPKNDDEGDSVKDYGKTSPNTGDESNPALWMSIMFVSGAAITGLILYTRKRKTK